MSKESICIVGLGYVGLPLAHAFAKAGHMVFGYDISKARIQELRSGLDRTGELTEQELRTTTITYSDDPTTICQGRIIILAIPTPVDAHNTPDLSLVIGATHTVGKHLQKGATVVYESTVYPGVTEEICGPILEKESGLRRGKDFTLGYSPERINPGDKEHTVDKIVKVVAAEDQETLDTLTKLYGSIVKAGIHRAPSIKVAEMAKTIENAQRDLNIAFINEVAMICNALDISTKDVLQAAGTKWNFLPFKPGLVGGHCIGVDPYYLLEVAKEVKAKFNKDTKIITAGREVNERMARYIAERVLATLRTQGIQPEKAHVLLLGLTFKEDVPDTRNSKCFDVAAVLKREGQCTVYACDPYVSEEEIERHGLVPETLEGGPYDALLLLVPHREYLKLPTERYISVTTQGGVIYDLKSVLDPKVIMESERIYLTL